MASPVYSSQRWLSLCYYNSTTAGRHTFPLKSAPTRLDLIWSTDKSHPPGCPPGPSQRGPKPPFTRPNSVIRPQSNSVRGEG